MVGKPRNQFSRDSISVGDSGPKRRWVNAAGNSLDVGDIIPDFGRIVLVQVTDGLVRYENHEGAFIQAGNGDLIHAFTFADEILLSVDGI